MREDQQEGQGATQGRVIGLDMHPDVFTAAALVGPDAQRAVVEWIHDRLPVGQLEAWLKRHVDPRDLIVIEASGNTFHTVDRIRAMGRAALVLEPVRASKVRKAYCTTDKVSAVKLARVYMSGLAMEVWTPDEKTRERREVVYAHRRAVQDSTRGRNRIRSWLNGFGLRKRRGLRLAQSSGQAWVLAQRSWTSTQQLLVKQMFSDLWQAESRRRALRQIMAEAVGTEPELLKLTRLFGLNVIAAYSLAAVVGDVHRFRTPKKLAAYLGLTPRVDRSGNRNRDGGSVRWGNTEMRRILIQAAQALLRYGEKTPLHRWALALKYRKGNNLAAFAVARKLVVAVWYVMKGLYSSLIDATPHFRRKLEELAKAIGSTRIRELGFEHIGDFRDKKLHILTGEA